MVLQLEKEKISLQEVVNQADERMYQYKEKVGN